jgi:hypothetical protein
LGWDGKLFVFNAMRGDWEGLDVGLRAILGDNKPIQSQFFEEVTIRANALECDGWVAARERGNWV